MTGNTSFRKFLVDKYPDKGTLRNASDKSTAALREIYGLPSQPC